MATGIRIKGTYGQLQISEDSPVNSILFNGNLGNLIQYTGAGDPIWATGVTFPVTITTSDQPLLFLRITNTVTILFVRIIGSPGAWTGFSVYGTNNTDAPGGGANPIAVQGTWFITTTQAAKSSAKYGIRIRNPITNAVVFDSGYPIAKFLSWTPQFNNVRVLSTGYDNSGRSGWWDWCRADTPVPYGFNGHFLANGYTGLITGAPGGETVFMRMRFNASSPYSVDLDVNCPSGTIGTVLGANAWNLVWATPGP